MLTSMPFHAHSLPHRREARAREARPAQLLRDAPDEVHWCSSELDDLFDRHKEGAAARLDASQWPLPTLGKAALSGARGPEGAVAPEQPDADGERGGRVDAAGGGGHEALPVGFGRIVASAVEAPTYCLRKSGVKWVSGGAKRQCDRALVG